MSGCNVAIKASAWRRYGLLGLGIVLFILFWIQPLPPVTLWLAAPLLCWLYWYGIKLYRQNRVASGLTIQSDGVLRWWQSQLPAGQLLAGCLVSEFGVLLRWRSPDNRLQQQWLLADQLTSIDYRALTRQLNQSNWQQSAGQQTDSDA